MNTSEQTYHQIERALKKTAAKCPTLAEDPILTDLYLQVKQDSGELLVFDDDDHELTRCVVEEWIDNNEENFYAEVQPILRKVIEEQKALIDSIHILRPYSFVLVDEDFETIAELYLVDDDTLILSHELMEGLSDDLDKFWQELSKM